MGVKRERWQSNFSEWFHDIIDKAEVTDYRYPIKGCGVWLPFGFKLRENILHVIRTLLNETGHEEVLFPQMITSDMLEKEAVHIESFKDQTFWITHAGRRELKEKLALRPTSETAIAPMLKLWIRSHADLPKKIYQIVSVFRYETKATRPLIRIREVTTFKEAHTSHESHQAAEEQVKVAVEIYKQFFDQLCLPYVISKRPEWDKFAGAVYSIAFDTVFPDGRTLQIGTAHDLGQNFSKAFGISFERENGTRDYVWQTSYGISERVIAAVIAIHGDDRGLVLPPSVAPIQIVVIPIPYKGSEEEIIEKSKEIAEKLKINGFRTQLDLREKLTPGSKYFEWELRGVPLRIEIGPRDLKEGTITLVRRDTLEKKPVKVDGVIEEAKIMLQNIEKNLKEQASAWLKNKIHDAESLEAAKVILEKESGIIELGWCGNDACGLKFEEKIDAKVLGTPADGKKLSVKRKCPICGEEAKFIIRLAKTY